MVIVDVCVADEDYSAGDINVTVDAGDTIIVICINITDDSIDEGDEAFGLVLKTTDETPDFVQIVDPMTAIGIIEDDDEPGWCNSV